MTGEHGVIIAICVLRPHLFITGIKLDFNYSLLVRNQYLLLNITLIRGHMSVSAKWHFNPDLARCTSVTDEQTYRRTDSSAMPPKMRS